MMRFEGSVPITAIVITGFLMLSAPVHAQRDGDGLYGRWDRAFTVGIGAGPSLSLVQGERGAGVSGEMRLLLADMVGIGVAGRWAPQAGQYLFVGVELRPLFPALFFLDWSTWNAFADLVIQSLYLEIGPAFLLDGNQSVGLGVGFGLSVPLYRPLKTVRGLWVRLGARYISADPSYSDTPDLFDRSEWTLSMTLVLRLGIKTSIGRWKQTLSH